LFSSLNGSFFTAIICAIFLSYPNFSYASSYDSQLTDLSLEELMDIEVVSATKMPEKLIEAPANMTVVTEQQIEERGYVTLIDLLGDLSGIDVYRYNNEEAKSYIGIRGSGGNNGNNKFIILMNGVKISSTTGETIPIEENFPLFNAKRVEVIYGPASSLYGADAFAGVINIITKPASEMNGYKLNLTAGSDNYAMGTFMGGESFSDDYQLTIGGHYHRADNPDLAKAFPTEYYSATNKYAGNTASHSAYLELKMFKSFTLGMRQSYYKSLTASGTKPATTTYGEDPKWETLMRVFYGKYNFAHGEKVSGETLFTYNTYEVLPASGYQNTFTNYARAYKYARDSSFKIEQQLNFELSATNLFTIGLSFEDTYALPKTADLPIPFDPNKPAGEQGLYHLGANNSVAIDVLETKYQNTAFYLQTKSSWSDKLSTTVGFRFDDNTRYGSSFNPRGGVVYNATDSSTIKVLYGESFLAPSPKVTYGPFGTISETSTGSGVYKAGWYHIPNPDLKPEKAKYIEIQSINTLSRNLVLSVSAFRTNVSDIIINETSSTPTTFSGITVATPDKNVNKGTATIYGGDLKIDYLHRLKNGDRIKFWGSYTLTDGDIDEEGSGVKSELPYVTKNKYKFGATYDTGYMTITPRVHIIGTQNHSLADTKDTKKRQKVDGYTVVHLTVRGSAIMKNLSVILDIRNLFDARYYSPGATSAPTTAFVSSPQDPRKFTFGVEYGF